MIFCIRTGNVEPVYFKPKKITGATLFVVHSDIQYWHMGRTNRKIAVNMEQKVRIIQLLQNQSFLVALYITSIFIFGQSISAQTNNKINLGLGPEWNMNSRKNFAGGVNLGFDYNLPFNVPFAVGLTVTGNSNFTGINVIEFAALFRWYFIGSLHNKWFVEANAGANMIFEDNVINPMFIGGLRAGYRFPLKSSFYIEPHGRLGYPYFWGIGVMAGYTFGRNKGIDEK